MANQTRYFLKMSVISVFLVTVTQGHLAFSDPGLNYKTPKAFSLFSNELKADGYPTAMVAIGLAHLKFVKFVTDENQSLATAVYYPNLSLMVLSRGDLQESSGLLRSVRSLSPDDLGVIYHEIWHSFFNRSGIAPAFIMRSVDSLYAGYDAKVRENIHEEAYGLFIQKVISSYIMNSRNIHKAPATIRSTLKVNPDLIRNYESVFTEPCYGYFRDPHLGLVWSTVSIDPTDKLFILHNLLEDKITGSFSLDFEKF
jgi:hypothetical protein